MRVHSWNISLQHRYLPDWGDDYVFSQQKSGISDEEYKKQIIEQAYIDYANGQFQNKSEGFNKLMKKYVSEVSPDRKGIITSGLKAVSRNRQEVLKPIDLYATLLEGEIRYKKLPTGKSEYIEFYDKNGEMVATYSNNGWTMYTTEAEAARQTEMCFLYVAAWRDAKNGNVQKDNALAEKEGLKTVPMDVGNRVLRELPDYIEDKPAFDRRA